MKNNYKAEDLLKKYKAGTCTDQEKAIIESWHIKELHKSNFMPDEEELEYAGKAIWEALPVHHTDQKSKTRLLWIKYSAAASIILMLSGAYYMLRFKEDKPASQVNQAERYRNDVKPGGNKAVLTLANGQVLVLEDTKAGLLANEGKTSIHKTTNGELIYNSDKKSAFNVLINKLTTPKGGKYQLSLPDGTKVWLNSSSTLTYPTAFVGTFREVQLTGEAYFEVAKNKDHPFKVRSEQQIVEVLGTHFNINNYPSEGRTRTTLLEGSVKVIWNAKDYMLKPGMQTEIGSEVKILTADRDQVMAWMNGDFVFKDENIRNIMHQLERWYDIEVVYQGKISDINFNAEISRSKSLVKVLSMLEKTGSVHFKIEERRVIVME
ncbi:FecR family protein [Pedobacter nutrimenti]|uniref:FecR family protein n=1 Tax=Pedobacter nutrimenti TaxID=1241337 RepID=UPI00292CC5BC|nr:FecR family protein [Pedobacter nutrimenti]